MSYIFRYDIIKNAYMEKSKILLILIFLIAFFLRFWQLESNPPSLTWDEAAWGYNAYSLGIDGKDEFGNFLPFTYLESFGDYKPPFYAYLTILPVKIFGLNEFSTRFASAFFGTLTVLLTYFLTIELFGANLKVKRKHVEYLAALSSFMLAISPWHILLSRAAFEANVASFFIVLGVYLFLLSTKKYKIIFPLSIVSFILSTYTFNTARVVAPIFLLCLLIIKRKNISMMKKEVILSMVIGLVLVLPLAMFVITPQAKLRFNEVNIFSDLNTVETSNQEIKNDNNASWSKIIHNRRFLYSILYLRHYFDNLNPLFLFIKGDGNPKFSIQDVGEMYIWEIPFFVTGLLLLFRKKEGNWWIIPLWLIIGIIPAGVARETPHALRIETTLPTFQIITAYGLYNFLVFTKYRISKIKYPILAITALIITLNLLYFLNNYFFHYPREFSGEWQYGYKDAVNYIKEKQNNYGQVFFTNSLGRPYIYLLYYLRFDPEKFRQNALIRREVYGFVHVDGFEKYRFLDNLGEDTVNVIGKRVMYIDRPEKIPGNAKILKEFYLLDGEKILVAYTK